MLTILHVSDLHFGPPYHPEVGEALRRFAHGNRPRRDRGLGRLHAAGEGGAVRGGAGVPGRLPAGAAHRTPGNHDVPLYRVLERLFDPYRHYRQHISQELDSVTEVPAR